MYSASFQKPYIATINSMWNGSPASGELHAQVQLRPKNDGLFVRVRGQSLVEQERPHEPEGSRVDGLWRYDVIEIFLVGANNHYIEVELGAFGHWLVLGFNGVRALSNTYIDFAPRISHQRTQESWESCMLIPWNLLPLPIVRMNAFAILKGEFLAFQKVPGAKPDFHQPQIYPEFHLDRP